MFSFFEEIAKLSMVPYEVFNSNFKIINFGNKVIYIEQFKNIVTFEPTEITVKLARGIVKILGENLKIKNMNTSSIIISGNITSLEVN